jgi:hypothetical protein
MAHGRRNNASPPSNRRERRFLMFLRQNNK